VDTGAGSGVYSTTAALSVDAPVCFFDGLAGLDPLALVTVFFFGKPFPCKRGISLCTGVSFGRARGGVFVGLWFRFLLVSLMAWPVLFRICRLFPVVFVVL
jgi:hypothetical protein